MGIIIPARISSSRFPEKPLALINGKPMIVRVLEQCRKAFDNSHIHVATDSERISSVVRKFGGNFVYTSKSCLTGTDRIAEANESLGYDYVINVQGDEPVIDPAMISLVAQTAEFNQSSVLNLATKIQTHDDYFSRAIPKCVFDENDMLLYMSRSPIPGGKDSEYQTAYKQVCVYGFSRQHLTFFRSNPNKTPLEVIEDIEILRFIESGITVKMLQVQSENIAVDHESDLQKVEQYLKSNSLD